MSSLTVFERAGATAMRRVEMSRPVRLALEHGVIRDGDDVFDYGCGHGDDVAFLEQLGHRATGWDPCHRPGTVRSPATAVNLGYVLNVIEKPQERVAALKDAYRLATRALIVSVRTTNETNSIADATPHADGLLTGAGTFQKLYRQSEARSFIDEVLDAQAVPLAPGVFVVFREEADEQEWLDRRHQLRVRVRRLRRIVEPKKTLRDMAYDQHRDVLRPLEEFIAERGRLPEDDEHAWIAAVTDAFGTVPKAFQVLRHVADEAWWDAAANDRRDELRVRFALARLRKRPKFSGLPHGLQRDVKSLFKSYKAACEQADELLYSIGDPAAIRAAIDAAPVGKVTPDSIYIHVDAVDLLPPVLRVFVGAADALVGEVADATLIKAHLDKPRVSYLVYPEFDTDPHPALAESWVVDFIGLDVRPTDYRNRDNPPVLHRKELFVAPDHPRYETFRRLTEQEMRHGLLDEPLGIGTRDRWTERLDEAGWRLAGHRLVRQE